MSRSVYDSVTYREIREIFVVIVTIITSKWIRASVFLKSPSKRPEPLCKIVATSFTYAAGG